MLANFIGDTLAPSSNMSHGSAGEVRDALNDARRCAALGLEQCRVLVLRRADSLASFAAVQELLALTFAGIGECASHQAASRVMVLGSDPLQGKVCVSSVYLVSVTGTTWHSSGGNSSDS